jgi:hypothetical protein
MKTGAGGAWWWRFSECFMSEIVVQQARAAHVFEFSGLVHGVGLRGGLLGFATFNLTCRDYATLHPSLPRW